MRDTRVLEDSAAVVLSPVFSGADGEAADCSASPTCAVTRDDGTVLDAAVVTDATGTGVYQAALTTTHTSRLDRLTLTWTGTVTGLGVQVLTQYVDVVGGFYLSVPDMRGFHGLSNLSFSAEALRAACSAFEDIAERYCGRAFVPRYRSETVRGSGTVRVLLDRHPVRSIVSASAVDLAGVVTPFDVTYWQVDGTGMVVTDGDVLTSASYGEANLTIRYIHGEPGPTSELRAMCGVWVARQMLVERSQVPRDALSVTSPDGFSTRYSTPDWAAGRPTGILEVDAVLNGLGRAAPAIA